MASRRDDPRKRVPERVPRPVLDTHELLKREMFASDSASCDDHFEKSRPCPSVVHGMSDQFLVLDTFHKVHSSRVDIGEFQWNFMIQGSTGDQVIGIQDELATVIEMQIGAFNIPVLPEVPYVLAAPPALPPSGLDQLVLLQNNTNAPGAPPTLVPNVFPFGQYPNSSLVPPNTFAFPWVNNPYSQVPFGTHISVQVKEAGLQGYKGSVGAVYQFQYTLDHLDILGQNPTILKASPIEGSGWDKFTFTTPLKDLHGVTLVLRNPDYPIRFEPDVFYQTVAAADLNVAPGPYLSFRFPGHNLLMGDRIIIRGFQSAIPTLDSYVNRREGHVAAGDPGVAPAAPQNPIFSALYPDTFWTDPAISIIDYAAPPAAQTVFVYVVKRRIRIPVRIRTVVDTLTNYKAP